MVQNVGQKRIQTIIAAVFFVGWLSILLAGADKPPPPGFVVIILIDLLSAGVVYWRVPTYMAWSTARRRYRLPQALLEGFVAGLLVALVVMLLPWAGEPSVQPRLVDRLIWFAVVGAVGTFNSGAIYGVCVYLSKIVAR